MSNYRMTDELLNNVTPCSDWFALGYSSTLKMEDICSSETSVDFQSPRVQ
jgi:hypothetical protein